LSEYSLNHYVPQFYLKRFTDPNGLLWVYDKDSDRVFSSTPKNITAEHGFYLLPGSVCDQPLLEQQLSDLEEQAALITQDWLRSLKPGYVVEIPEVNREIMSLYFAIQMLRTCEARSLLLQALCDPKEVPSEEEAQRLMHIALLWDDDLVKQISDWIYSCTWTFRVNSLPESLYTSDDPIKVRSHSRHLYWAQTSEEGAYLVIPMTPRIIMYCFEPRRWHMLKQFDCTVFPKPLEPELITDANIHQAGHARRFLFSDTGNFSLAREFCKRHPDAVGQNRKRFVE